MNKAHLVCCVQSCISVPTARSLFETIFKAPTNGFELGIILADETGLERSRSLHSTLFLDNLSLGDVMMFVDSDVSFQAESAYKLITECSKVKSVVGGIYPTRKGEIRGTASNLYMSAKIQLGENQPLLKVDDLPAGFLAIHRNVLEDLAKTMNRVGKKNKYQYYPFFKTRTKRYSKDECLWFTEDYSFCDRCRDMGIDVWLDQSIYLKHIGQKEFTWDDIE